METIFCLFLSRTALWIPFVDGSLGKHPNRFLHSLRKIFMIVPIVLTLCCTYFWRSGNLVRLADTVAEVVTCMTPGTRGAGGQIPFSVGLPVHFSPSDNNPVSNIFFDFFPIQSSLTDDENEYLEKNTNYWCQGKTMQRTVITKISPTNQLIVYILV